MLQCTPEPGPFVLFYNANESLLIITFYSLLIQIYGREIEINPSKYKEFNICFKLIGDRNPALMESDQRRHRPSSGSPDVPNQQF